jgi:hypothetical protein
MKHMKHLYKNVYLYRGIIPAVMVSSWKKAHVLNSLLAVSVVAIALAVIL